MIRPLSSAFPWLVITTSVIVHGCGWTNDVSRRRGDTGSALSDQPSPNASIFPEPLGNNQTKPFEKSAASPLASTSELVVPRPKRVFMPDRVALDEDVLAVGATGGGYRAHGRFVWSTTQSNLVHSGTKIQTWPQLTFELLREVSEQAARLRIVLSSPVFSLPEGTEIRLRADRMGSIVVWPDRRSYRPIMPGTLSALFADRRADRLPFVDATLKVLDAAQRAGRPLTRHKIETTLGVAEMELVELPDLPYGAPLLCEVLLDMVRVNSTEQLCPLGHLPLRFAMNWRSGGGFLFEVLGYVQEPRLALDDQRMPPLLPIYKPGELPPRGEFFLAPAVREQVFAIKKAGEPLLPRPAPSVPGAAEPAVKEARPAQETLAPDEIILRNNLDRSLIVQLDRLPLLWLGPGEQRHLRVSSAPIAYLARDFWGQQTLEPGLVPAPSVVSFGDVAPSAPP